ncbi:MAG: hypothetical protein AAGG07_09420 [Planctomycetota bacterium]
MTASPLTPGRPGNGLQWVAPAAGFIVCMSAVAMNLAFAPLDSFGFPATGFWASLNLALAVAGLVLGVFIARWARTTWRAGPAGPRLSPARALVLVTLAACIIPSAVLAPLGALGFVAITTERSIDQRRAALRRLAHAGLAISCGVGMAAVVLFGHWPLLPLVGP